MHFLLSMICIYVLILVTAYNHRSWQLRKMSFNLCVDFPSNNLYIYMIECCMWYMYISFFIEWKYYSINWIVQYSFKEHFIKTLILYRFEWNAFTFRIILCFTSKTLKWMTLVEIQNFKDLSFWNKWVNILWMILGF